MNNKQLISLLNAIRIELDVAIKRVAENENLSADSIVWERLVEAKDAVGYAVMDIPLE